MSAFPFVILRRLFKQAVALAAAVNEKRADDLVKRVEKAEEKKSPLDLGDILQVLDGIPERHATSLLS